MHLSSKFQFTTLWNNLKIQNHLRNLLFLYYSKKIIHISIQLIYLVLDVFIFQIHHQNFRYLIHFLHFLNFFPYPNYPQFNFNLFILFYFLIMNFFQILIDLLHYHSHLFPLKYPYSHHSILLLHLSQIVLLIFLNFNQKWCHYQFLK